MAECYWVIDSNAYWCIGIGLLLGNKWRGAEPEKRTTLVREKRGGSKVSTEKNAHWRKKHIHIIDCSSLQWKIRYQDKTQKRQIVQESRVLVLYTEEIRLCHANGNVGMSFRRDHNIELMIESLTSILAVNYFISIWLFFKFWALWVHFSHSTFKRRRGKSLQIIYIYIYITKRDLCVCVCVEKAFIARRKGKPYLLWLCVVDVIVYLVTVAVCTLHSASSPSRSLSSVSRTSQLRSWYFTRWPSTCCSVETCFLSLALFSVAAQEVGHCGETSLKPSLADVWLIVVINN